MTDTLSKEHDAKGKGRAMDESSEDEGRSSAFKKPKLKATTHGAFSNGKPSSLNSHGAGSTAKKQDLDPVVSLPNGKSTGHETQEPAATESQIASTSTSTSENGDEWNGLETASRQSQLVDASEEQLELERNSSPRPPAFTSTGSLLGRLNPTTHVAAMNSTPLSSPNPTISPPSSVASSRKLNDFHQLSIEEKSSNGSDIPAGSKKKRKKRKKKLVRPTETGQGAPDHPLSSSTATGS